MKRVMAVVVVLVLCLNFVACGNCQDAMRKLGRGAVNIVSSPLEIPKTMIDTFNKDKGLPESFFFGLPVGIVKMVARLGAGVYETVTFPVPLPGDYEPLVQPEFVLDQ